MTKLSWEYWTAYLTIMANNDTRVTRDTPLADLTADALKHLDSIKGELDTAAADLEALEEIGIDTSRLREKIEWGKKAREVILKRFGPPKK